MQPLQDMKKVLHFFTPEHPIARRWGGSSPMLAREFPWKDLDNSDYRNLSRSKVMRMWKKADLSDVADHNKEKNKLLSKASWFKAIPTFLGFNKKSENKENIGTKNKVSTKEVVKEKVKLRKKRKICNMEESPRWSSKDKRSQDNRLAMAAYSSSLFCTSAFAPIVITLTVNTP
ncbi:hypothetical protein O6H91_09G027600 [Diphasiastrum complanatum]|uniref:Uncharacterized protein n=4 Tax=Diphasiastrum complanatum TaxID=34168 RepID=A0ACC2CMC5_DIPCM|nr:hypothetical protein O6H91_09G027600 [Diphasiastrum complanatum]KAJ7543161.1 hypothetical protein O6H91_09G027600 [Diphasiastrum complanatum]KAJ7543162.1 hypothetical protein O6H91_09G027600 [Diphasiastrum complanatum]KAJ7543164.1 hypothetical protein O6H91_09G027600 [Diphasiastrum complanatum]